MKIQNFDMDAKTRNYCLYCGIKKLWHNKGIESFTNDPTALGTVMKYLESSRSFLSKGMGLFLYGANGTGKSHLLNCSFIRFIKDGYKVRVYSFDEIIDMYTSSWYSDEDRHSLSNMLRSVDFLGIDEFGKNLDADGNPMYLPDLAKRVMESVIRFRVQMGKPIWFTSNTEPKYVKQVFSEDIASLLREAVIPVCVRGEDFRKVIQRRNKEELL